MKTVYVSNTHTSITMTLYPDSLLRVSNHGDGRDYFITPDMCDTKETFRNIQSLVVYENIYLEHDQVYHYIMRMFALFDTLPRIGPICLGTKKFINQWGTSIEIINGSIVSVKEASWNFKNNRTGIALFCQNYMQTEFSPFCSVILASKHSVADINGVRVLARTPITHDDFFYLNDHDYIITDENIPRLIKAMSIDRVAEGTEYLKYDRMFWYYSTEILERDPSVIDPEFTNKKLEDRYPEV